MGALKEFLNWKQDVSQESAKRFSAIQQDLASRVPPELQQWWIEQGEQWIDLILGSDRAAIWYCQEREANLALSGFTSLEDAESKLGLLRGAWANYFEVVSVRVWEGDREVTMGISAI